jgi:hypothetical protein
MSQLRLRVYVWKILTRTLRNRMHPTKIKYLTVTCKSHWKHPLRWFTAFQRNLTNASYMEMKLVYIGYEVLTAVVMNVILWDIALCTSYVNWHFGGTYPSSVFDSEDGGDSFLRNVGSYMDYTRLYPLRWQHLKPIYLCKSTILSIQLFLKKRQAAHSGLAV